MARQSDDGDNSGNGGGGSGGGSDGTALFSLALPYCHIKTTTQNDAINIPIK